MSDDLESPRDDSSGDRDPLQRVVLGGVLFALILWLFVGGRQFLVPLTLAVFIWVTVEALNGFVGKFRIGSCSIPAWARSTVSILVIFALIWAFLTLVASNVAKMTEAAPEYQSRITALYEQGLAKFNIEGNELADAIFEQVDLGSMVASIGALLGGLIGDAMLIAVYVIFLMLEKRYFSRKIDALFPNDAKKKASVRQVLLSLDERIKIYLGVKVVVSLLTAVVSYAIMKLVGLDFAEFWAVLIFIFNFIPYIGSTVATILPTLLALIQFETVQQALIIGIGVECIQLAVGNFVEPNLMGRSLNISALGVLISLTLWGILWGIVGMFLAVPIAVVIMIICAEFDATRWLAVFLSKDGSLPKRSSG